MKQREKVRIEVQYNWRLQHWNVWVWRGVDEDLVSYNLAYSEHDAMVVANEFQEKYGGEIERGPHHGNPAC